MSLSTVRTRFYLELSAPGSHWAALEKVVDMPYKVCKEDSIQVSFGDEGELDFTVQGIYFDISRMELTASLGALHLKDAGEYKEILADFIKQDWQKQ